MVISSYFSSLPGKNSIIKNEKKKKNEEEINIMGGGGGGRKGQEAHRSSHDKGIMEEEISDQEI